MIFNYTNKLSPLLIGIITLIVLTVLYLLYLKYGQRNISGVWLIDKIVPDAINEYTVEHNSITGDVVYKFGKFGKFGKFTFKGYKSGSKVTRVLDKDTTVNGVIDGDKIIWDNSDLWTYKK